MTNKLTFYKFIGHKSTKSSTSPSPPYRSGGGGSSGGGEATTTSSNPDSSSNNNNSSGDVDYCFCSSCYCDTVPLLRPTKKKKKAVIFSQHQSGNNFTSPLFTIYFGTKEIIGVPIRNIRRYCGRFKKYLPKTYTKFTGS